MEKPMVRIHDMSTDEIIDREMTDDEFAEHEARLVKMAEAEKAAADKETARQAVYAKLGLTLDEVALLLNKGE